MRNYNTVNDIKTEIEILVRNMTGRNQLTAGETDVVYSAIVDAYQFVILEYGVSVFKFQETELEVNTVAGQNYVDLDAYIYRVITGTVKIPDLESILVLLDEEKIHMNDPGATQTGTPYMYAYIGSGDPDKIRLILWPTPDAAVTITMQVLKYPTDVITEFPAALMSAIKNQAKSLACLGLGLPQLQPGFDRAYEKIIAKLKDGFDGDSPKHVSKKSFNTTARSIESRISK